MPYVGAFVSAAFPMALAAMIDPSWWKLIEVAAVFVIGDPLVGQILEPLLFGSQTRLSPLAILLAIAFWTLLWGPIGLVLAVPLTLSIVVMGQHVPRLEFLRVLLGNEPVLEPHEKLYHQLLAGEPQIAAKDADRWIGEHSLVQYLDEVVIPAFRFASGDQRRAVLGREQTNEFKEATEEYVGLMQEAIEYKFEPEGSSAASEDDAKLEAGRRSPTALVLAGRGSEDLAVSQLIADAIRLERGIDTRCSPLGGLTGISSAAESGADDPPEVVALVSVGTVTRAQLDILLRRLRRSFPRSHIVVGYWDGRVKADRRTWRPKGCATRSWCPHSSTSSAGKRMSVSIQHSRFVTSARRRTRDRPTLGTPSDRRRHSRGVPRGCADRGPRRPAELGGEAREYRVRRKLRAADEERVAVRSHRLASEGADLFGGDAAERSDVRGIQRGKPDHADVGALEERRKLRD